MWIERPGGTLFSDSLIASIIVFLFRFPLELVLWRSLANRCTLTPSDGSLSQLNYSHVSNLLRKNTVWNCCVMSAAAATAFCDGKHAAVACVCHFTANRPLWLLPCSWRFFTARRYASAKYTTALCPDVCHSHTSVLRRDQNDINNLLFYSLKQFDNIRCDSSERNTTAAVRDMITTKI